MKRNLNEERFSTLEDKRVCKICTEEKLIKDFQYHSATGYFAKTCQECINKQKRNKFAEKALLEGRTLDTTHTLNRRKTCIKCKEEKDLNSEFPTKGRAYSNVCRDCMHTALNKKEALIYLGEVQEKVCTTCQIKKDRGEFPKFLAPSGNVLLKSFCKNCDSKRERKPLKVSRLFTQYRYADIRNNQEFNLTKEFIKESLEKSCTYCGFPSTGLDRIKNELGHTNNNSIPCCWECNTARMNNFSYEEMLIIGQTIKEVKLKR